MEKRLRRLRLTKRLARRSSDAHGGHEQGRAVRVQRQHDDASQSLEGSGGHVALRSMANDEADSTFEGHEQDAVDVAAVARGRGRVGERHVAFADRKVKNEEVLS